MNPGRLFVTFVVLLSIPALTACPGKDKNKGKQTEFVTEGNDKIKQAQSVENELASGFKIFLPAQPVSSRGRVAPPSAFGANFNWKRLSKAERQAAKEKLASFVAIVSRVLELDSKKGIYTEPVVKEKLMNQHESALAYQKSLQKFESLYGENFEPKVNGEPQPLYSQAPTIEI